MIQQHGRWGAARREQAGRGHASNGRAGTVQGGYGFRRACASLAGPLEEAGMSGAGSTPAVPQQDKGEEAAGVAAVQVGRQQLQGGCKGRGVQNGERGTLPC